MQPASWREVHKSVGRGLLQSICEEALCNKFALRNIPYKSLAEVDVIYKGKIIKGQRLDLPVAGKVVVELKSIPKLQEVCQLADGASCFLFKSDRTENGLDYSFARNTLSGWHEENISVAE